MSEPYLGEIILFAGNFAPRGWMFCAGQILSIAQNTALFSLLGTTYGGNGQTTFALPDLRGRSPIGQGQGPGLSDIVLGEVGGVENVTLTIVNMPAHNHQVIQSGSASATVSVAIPAVTTDGDTATPGTGKVLAQSVETTVGGAVNIYGNGPGTTSLTPFNATGAVTLPSIQTGITGNNMPVAIRDPFLGLNYIIAVQGIYPSRN